MRCGGEDEDEGWDGMGDPYKAHEMVVVGASSNIISSNPGTFRQFSALSQHSTRTIKAPDPIITEQRKADWRKTATTLARKKAKGATSKARQRCHQLPNNGQLRDRCKVAVPEIPLPVLATIITPSPLINSAGIALQR